MDEKAGHDIRFIAISDTLDQLKTVTGEQAMHNVQSVDSAEGSDTAIIAVLATVFAAQWTGRGQYDPHGLYQYSLMRKATAQMNKAINGHNPEPKNDFLGALLPYYRLYKKDDCHIAIKGLEFKFFEITV